MQKSCGKFKKCFYNEKKCWLDINYHNVFKILIFTIFLLFELNDDTEY